MIALVILAFSLAVIPETLSLIKKKYWRELAVFAAIYLAAFISSVLLTLGYELPSPAKGTESLIKWVFSLFT